MLRRLARRLTLRFFEFAAKQDVWRRFPYELPAGAFGHGERTPAGATSVPSVVEVREIQDVLDWLGSCRRVDRSINGSAADIVTELQQTHNGNCKSFTLWAFARLQELGYSPEIVVGRWVAEAGPETVFHAWVQFEEGGETFLLETMLSPSSAAIRPLREAKEDYLPRYGTDLAGNGFAFLDHFRTVLREGA